MNQRAFNLFTALVGMVLIMLTMLLVYSMINSESNTRNIISDIREQSRLESTAQLTRADAIQIFNYGMRQTIEKWLARGNVFTLPREAYHDWDKMVSEFADKRFGGTGDESGAFAFEAANVLVGLFQGFGFSFGSYSVSLQNPENFRPIMQAVVKVSVEDDDFFQVIECDGTPKGCPKGTFYVNLKMSKLDDATYEQLPQLYFIDHSTGRELKDPILPRQDIKLYVPLRIFKALTIARAFAHSPDALNSAQINGSRDYGLLSPRIHNEIDSMGLGYCDAGYCMPRTNPLGPPSSKADSTNGCASIGGATDLITNKRKTQRTSTGKNYNPSNNTNAENVLSEIVDERICFLAEEITNQLELEEDFQIVGSQECQFLDEINSSAESVTSKTITIGTGTGGYGGSAGNYSVNSSFGSSSSNCQVAGAGTGNGWYLEGNKIKIFEPGKNMCLGLAGNGGKAFCSGISQVNVIVKMIENNPKYKVNKSIESTYKIKILDNTYTAFNPNYEMLNISGNCAYSGIGQDGSCNPNDWICKITGINYGSITDSGQPVSGGCVPA